MDLSTLLTLFYEFFCTGLFAVGGGLATLPFLYNIADKYPWFNLTELVDMIAISESTPGPLGINMATFAGFKAAGIPGGIVATLAIIVPSLIIIIMIAKVLAKFKENKYVNYAFYGVRAAVGALILKAGIDIVTITLVDTSQFADISKVFNYPAILLFVVIFILLRKFKWHPIIYILMSVGLGLLFKVY